MDAVRELSSIEIGTYRSQDVLGQGNSTGANYDLASGTSNEIGNGSSTSATSGWMSYRGIENFYASILNLLTALTFVTEPFVNGDHRTFESNVFTGDYVTAGVTQPDATVTSLQWRTLRRVSLSPLQQVPRPRSLLTITTTQVIVFGFTAVCDTRALRLVLLVRASSSTATIGAGLAF